MDSIVYCLGVDPAKEKATLCLIDSRGKMLIAPFDAPANREGFDQVSERLVAVLKPEDDLLIGVEASAALDDNWLAYFQALKAHCNVSVLRLDAAQVKAFSGAMPVRAKTDNADARRIANFIRQYGGELAHFEHDPANDAMLAVLSDRESIVADLTRLKNRLQDRLIVCFPELAAVIGNVYSQKALALLEEMPTAAVAARKHVATIAKIKGRAKGSHRIGEELAVKIKQAAETSIASQSSGVFEGLIQRLVKRIRLYSEQLNECNVIFDDFVSGGREDNPAEYNDPAKEHNHANIDNLGKNGGFSNTDDLADEQDAEEKPVAPPSPSIPRQCALLTTIPGVSNVVAATVALRSRGLGRFRSAKAFSAQLATHPQRHQTGTTKDTAILARRGDRHSRPVLFLAAMCAARDNQAFAFYKWHHESSGQTPKQAICSVMNRMTRLMWTLVRDNRAYDESILLTNIMEQHGKEWKAFLAYRAAKKSPKTEKKEPKKSSKRG